jgi:hypothetical protein
MVGADAIDQQRLAGRCAAPTVRRAGKESERQKCVESGAAHVLYSLIECVRRFRRVKPFLGDGNEKASEGEISDCANSAAASANVMLVGPNHILATR